MAGDCGRPDQNRDGRKSRNWSISNLPRRIQASRRASKRVSNHSSLESRRLWRPLSAVLFPQRFHLQVKVGRNDVESAVEQILDKHAVLVSTPVLQGLPNWPNKRYWYVHFSESWTPGLIDYKLLSSVCTMKLAADKMEQADSALGSSRLSGYLLGIDKKKEDSQLSKASRDGIKSASEQIAGVMTQVLNVHILVGILEESLKQQDY